VTTASNNNGVPVLKMMAFLFSTFPFSALSLPFSLVPLANGNDECNRHGKMVHFLIAEWLSAAPQSNPVPSERTDIDRDTVFPLPRRRDAEFNDGFSTAYVIGL
jgi:hypothetical protein